MARQFGLHRDPDSVDIRTPRPLIILLCGFLAALVLIGIYIA